MPIVLDGSDPVGDLGDALAAKADLASPTFTGTPAAPTAAAGTNTTQLATTAFVLANGPTSATDSVLTSQSTTATSFADLATVGPTVTLTTGTKALVFYAVRMTNNTSGPVAYASVAVSGASTVAASDNWGLYYDVVSATYKLSLSRAILFTGLTAGSNTFTVKYKVSSSTGVFAERSIVVLNMGS